MIVQMIAIIVERELQSISATIATIAGAGPYPEKKIMTETMSLKKL